jgi:uncharacterized repeat protein (TIGR03803 family)
LAQRPRPALTPVFSALYTFVGGGDGIIPVSLTTGPDGALFGAATLGGSIDCAGYGDGCGTVFQLVPPVGTGGSWTESVIYRFGWGDGAFPYGGLVVGKNGALYGATYAGGAFGVGAVFELRLPAVAGGLWRETVLHSFDANAVDGFDPYAPVTVGKGGVLYGTTSGGGAYHAGTVFQLTPPAAPGDPWVEAVLYSFAGETIDGGYPTSGVTIGSEGELYGTTPYCGASGVGTVFELIPPPVVGGPWTQTIIHTFTYMTGDWYWPYAGLVAGRNGVLYGTTSSGGSSIGGAVLRLMPPALPAGEWTETLLYSFTGGVDGSAPKAGLILGSNGLLYGTTSAGGSLNLGTMFLLAPPPTRGGTWTPAVLHSFGGGADGGNPVAALVFGRMARSTAQRRGVRRETAWCSGGGNERIPDGRAALVA